ncbi:hypothetical protein KPA97_06485, partial [Burkholderia cenocepacia]|nr:hypothetical protein [Burkholderia cenocepacia]
AALALPPGGHAQSASAPPLEPAAGGATSISTVPSGIATGVFGTYGGAESRFSGAGGASAPVASLRAPLRALELPDLGDGSGGALTPRAERRLGERVMREVRRDPPATSSPSLDVLAADIARRAGRTDDAVRLSALAQRRWPASHAAIVAHLQALLAARRFAEAQTLARAQAKADPEQPDWWDYLAKASDGKGDVLARRRAL